MEEPAAYAPPAVPVKLPVLPCPVCGEINTVVLGPGRGPHVAALHCQAGHHIKWAPKALLGLEKESPPMDCLNLCVFSGYLDRDPALRFREDGTAHCTATLRVEEVSTQGTVHRYYAPLEAFGKTGEALAEHHSGALLLIQSKAFWRKPASASGSDKGASTYLVQKVSLLAPPPSLTGSTN